MAYEILRKKCFLNKLIRILDFLQNEWGNKSAVDFLTIIDKKIDILRLPPNIEALCGISDIRSFGITKHNRLFYRIIKNKVVIINIYDTRKNRTNLLNSLYYYLC